jgi:indolepyruvate ferredoxin oxidoreductase beta subunit
MKTDIILAGVGGQGILSIATVIGMAAIDNGLHIKQAEVHGMSQRGGAVYSNLRLSDKPIASDLIPLGGADLVLSVEPMEALRYVPYLAVGGWLVTNTHPFINIDNYPDPVSVEAQLGALPHCVMIDADGVAGDCGNRKASNMVMLGAAVPFLTISVDDVEEAVIRIFERKGPDVVKANVGALRAGYHIAAEEVEKKEMPDG